MTNSLINRLREAKTIAAADPVLKELRANPSQFKLVEASILQRMSPNPASYEYGVTMLNTVIRELDPEEEPAEPEAPGIKRKGDHFVKEEELANGNTGERNEGSEQSTENVEPYTAEGKKEGDEDMLNAPDTENQMSETNDKEEAPFPKNLNEMGGLHPDIAKQMGAQMPKIPPMDSGNQIKQMQYTIKKYHETIVKPLMARAKIQETAIRKLSQKIRETEARAGTYVLDMDVVKSNAPARIRETISSGIPASVSSPQELVAYTQRRNKDFDLNTVRSEISQMNDQMSQ